LPSPTFNKKGTSSDTALIISRLGTEIEDIEEDRGITLRRIRWTALVFPDSRSSFVSEPRAQSMCLMLSHDPQSVTPSLARHLLATEHHRQREIHVRPNQSPTSRVRLDAKALALSCLQ